MAKGAAQPRSEQDIFDELTSLCTQPGYIHAVAFLSFRDHVVGYGDILEAKDYEALFSPDRLIRTELSTVIGLMMKAPRDLSRPSEDVLSGYISRTEELLLELHAALRAPGEAKLLEAMKAHSIGIEINPFESAEVLREPIFYAAESAYPFQYRDLFVDKHKNDVDWLKNSMGFSPEEGRAVVSAISDILSSRLIPIVTEADSRDSQKPTNLNRWRKQGVCDGFGDFVAVRL